MKVRYTFTVYADTSVSEEDANLTDELKEEMVASEAIKHMKRLLNTKCDFSDVDFELVNTETVED